MQLLALFPQRAAAHRARIRLIESGIAPDGIFTVDKRTEDFLIDDEDSHSHVSFWAHVTAVVRSENALRALERQLRRGACLLSVHAPQDPLRDVPALLKNAGAQMQWKQRAGIPGERDEHCSLERSKARPRT